MQVKIHVWFRNLSSLSENITSEMAETHKLTARQHGCFNVQSVTPEKSVVWPSPQCCLTS
jgi:hypothetical protein